jgi:hypothetical protein
MARHGERAPVLPTVAAHAERDAAEAVEQLRLTTDDRGRDAETRATH